MRFKIFFCFKYCLNKKYEKNNLQIQTEMSLYDWLCSDKDWTNCHKYRSFVCHRSKPCCSISNICLFFSIMKNGIFSLYHSLGINIQYRMQIPKSRSAILAFDSTVCLIFLSSFLIGKNRVVLEVMNFNILWKHFLFEWCGNVSFHTSKDWACCMYTILLDRNMIHVPTLAYFITRYTHCIAHVQLHSFFHEETWKNPASINSLNATI